eukprot:504488_1
MDKNMIIMEVLNSITAVVGLTAAIYYAMVIMLRHNIEFKFHTDIAVLSLIAIIMFTISSCTMVYMFTKVTINEIYIETSLFVANMITIIEISWRMGESMGQMLLYVIFLKRLKHSFSNTKYKLSKWIYHLVYFGIIVFVMLYIITKSIFMIFLP